MKFNVPIIALVMISVLATMTVANEKDEAAPWLRYEETGSRRYGKVVVELFKNNQARVDIAKRSHAPRIEYVTVLTPAEMAWFRTVVSRTDFSNPDRLEREADGGGGGITEVEVFLDDTRLRATFGHDPFFDNLSRTCFRLVRQAELMHRLEQDHHAYDIRTALTNKTVLQPAAFVDPLKTYILTADHQLDDAMNALALVTTPEEWGGVLAMAFERASDELLQAGSSFSRRHRLLNVIKTHPFYVDLPNSHQGVLIQIYRQQSAIETAKSGDQSARYVRIFKENEAHLKRRMASD